MTSVLRLMLSILPLAAVAGPASATVRALLVGVSDYHVLDADLQGPRNDVALMAEALLARGAEAGDIRVLASPEATLPAGLAEARDPTRAAILGALDQLAAEARPGDTVLFYYSGHGSQAPDLSGDDAGGYDEILLPSDAAGWKGSIGAVENAIVDDELQPKMQAILDSGAALVAIIDACNSATGFRDLGGAGVARYVAPQALGIPEDLAGADESDHVAPPLSGDFAFLYSSQSDERSFEYPIGDGADPANWYGDFTRNLTAVLTAVPDLTWAQALAAAADGLRQEQASQTPDGEGPGLAQPVFGGAPATPRMRVEAGVLTEGLLSGLAVGAEVELFDAAAGGGHSLGRATLVEVEASRSVLDHAGALPRVAYAELRAPGAPPLVRMAAPAAADNRDYSTAFAFLDEVRSDDLADGIEWSGEDYDLRLIGSGGDLVLVGRDGVLDPAGPGSSPRIPASAAPDAILAFIDRAARVSRLRSALAAAEGRRAGFGFPGVGLAVDGVQLRGSRLAAGCGAVSDAASVLQDRSVVSDCDELWLAVSNTSKTAQDVTVLYVDRDLRIVPIWPQEDLSNRVAFGETARIGLQVQAEAGLTGQEEIIVIAVPARDGAPRTVLTGLADPAPSRGLGAGTSDTAAWLLAAADPDAQARDFRPGARTDKVSVTRIRLTLGGE